MSTAEPLNPPVAAFVTANELLHISVQLHNEGKRCELVRGELVVMSPTKGPHGVVTAEVHGLLYMHLRGKSLGSLFAAETGFLVSVNPDTVRAPDIAFVRRDRIEALGLPASFFPEAPTLAVEVVSPSESAKEVHEKAKMWIESGCGAVWLVWPGDRTVTDYRSLDNIRVLTADQTLEGGDAVPGFSAKVADLFVGLS
ncbi:MAG: Uma2 family endonuclease [Planctomycetota bacterium]